MARWWVNSITLDNHNLQIIESTKGTLQLKRPFRFRYSMGDDLGYREVFDLVLEAVCQPDTA